MRLPFGDLTAPGTDKTKRSLSWLGRFWTIHIAAAEEGRTHSYLVDEVIMEWLAKSRASNPVSKFHLTKASFKASCSGKIETGPSR